MKMFYDKYLNPDCTIVGWLFNLLALVT